MLFVADNVGRRNLYGVVGHACETFGGQLEQAVGAGKAEKLLGESRARQRP
jgi:hypothetical protein